MCWGRRGRKGDTGHKHEVRVGCREMVRRTRKELEGRIGVGFDQNTPHAHMKFSVKNIYYIIF